MWFCCCLLAPRIHSGSIMKKTDPAIVEHIREHARLHPEETYEQIAVAFGLSLISVKRFCADLGRSKSWRRGRASDVLDADRLWSRVKRKEGQCWPWAGCKNSDGYGFMHMRGRSLPVHRIAYEVTRGSIPDGMDIDHRCRNRVCCNPNHLEVVSHRENMARAGII